MKTINFTPLRLVKKTGKITVASYLKWREVKVADQSEFELILNDSHNNFDPSAPVHNHKGELLFWFNHQEPEKLPLNYPDKETIAFLRNDDEVEQYRVDILEKEPLGIGFHYSVKGFDCDGVPVFSHNTYDYIATHYKDMTRFEVLTVGTVIKWYGWFLLQLENSILKDSTI